MRQPLLKIKHLTKSYRSGPHITVAVNDVSFEVYKGESLGLVGESGSGKTTIGKSIVRLVNVDEGEIFYNEQDILKLSQKHLHPLRQELQMILQNPSTSLNPLMTIGEIISEPIEIFNTYDPKKRKRRIRDLLHLVGLRSYHGMRYPHEMSVGQKQRVTIARALALNPNFLICDEPLASLDVSIQAQMINLLKDLQNQMDLTYLFISHDLGVVKYLCDRVAVMYKGEIVEIADTQTLFENPEHPYTKSLLEAIPTLSAREKVNATTS
ncbi:MAG: Oligopeptide transport ATP-binding protein OppF [Chlamydiia bacterium]|nr:Oligopeptide transport ATP-binding protein OppF [Chlamydiia bacterium]